MAVEHLTAQILRELLHYCPESGVFTRLRSTGTAKRGDLAGWKEPHGYIKISILGRKHYAHRCAILYVTGEWPCSDVDHIDGNKSNNSISNLRVVTRQTNMQNQHRPQSRNKSGFLGVTFHKGAGRYMAECKAADGKRYYLGLHDTAELAYAAYLEAKRKLHKGCTL